MSRAARLLLEGLAAALLGCVAGALLLVGTVDPFSFIPLPMLWLGTLLLLAPADAWLRGRGLAMPIRAVPVMLAGAIGYAALAALLGGGAPGSAVMGGVYGLLTAGAWAGLGALADRRP